MGEGAAAVSVRHVFGLGILARTLRLLPDHALLGDRVFGVRGKGGRARSPIKVGDIRSMDSPQNRSWEPQR